MVASETLATARVPTIPGAPIDGAPASSTCAPDGTSPPLEPTEESGIRAVYACVFVRVASRAVEDMFLLPDGLQYSLRG